MYERNPKGDKISHKCEKKRHCGEGCIVLTVFDACCVNQGALS